jgi:hypothetical protein
MVNKVDATRVRRLSKRLGFRVERSRAKAVRPHDRGLYQVRDAKGAVVMGEAFEASLDAVEAYLREREAELLPARSA